MRHKKDGAVGKAKETQGAATGDATRKAQGRSQQRKTNLRQAGERVRAAFKK